MPFHLTWRTEFLNRPPTAEPTTILGNAAPYGVHLEQCSPQGQQFWRVIGVHHLTPDENRGRHAVYVDVIDVDGQRIRDPNLRLRWGWAGQRADERVEPKLFDKPASEPGANVDLYKGQQLWVQIEGDGLPSDRVSHCHTAHPDEPGPSGETWNSIGHHSFYIVFQRTRPIVIEKKPDEGHPLLETPIGEPLVKDHAVYLRDRIADGSRFPPGATIHQIWTVRNSGATPWQTGYQLTFRRGNPLGAIPAIPVPPTAPGAEANLAVAFTAPQAPGAYRSDWQLRNAAGEWFGERLWLDIQVEPTVQSATAGQGNKLGFYLHLSTDQHGLWDAIRRVQPPVLLIHADTANTMLLEEIRRFRAPDAFVIGRLYKDVHTQRQMLEHDDPEGQGRALAEEILSYNFGLATKRGANGRLLIDAWMSLNEAVPGPASAQFHQQPAATARLLQHYDRFQVAFRQKLQEAGIEAVAFNFGAGNFATAEHYLDHFPNTLAHYTYLGFHEYGWPTLYPAAGSATCGGNYRRCMEGIRARYGNRHRVVITEAGLTRMYQNPAWGDVGWLNEAAPLSQADYWASLAWYNGQLTADAYVVGACLFEVGHHGNWATFRHLGQDNQGKPLALIDRIVALNEGAQPRRPATRGGEAIPAPSPARPAITIGGRVTSLGRPVAGASVRLVGTQATLGGVREAAADAGTAVTWTRRVTDLRGSIWNGWRKYVAGKVAGLTYGEFKELVGIYNPSLQETNGQFTDQRTYFLPENPYAAEIVWDRPLTDFAGSRWACWQRYVENKVIGLSYAAFKKAVLAHNPLLQATQGQFQASERYTLPRNADQQQYLLTATTGARGRFHFPDLPAGAYQLTVRAPGLQPFLTGFSAIEAVDLAVTLPPNLPAQLRAMSRSAADAFVRVHGDEFAVNRRPFRFIGVNIRGLVHYGDRQTLQHATEAHRREQLAAAYDMGARVVRVFLPSMHASPAQTIARLDQVLTLMADFPGLYLLPALSNLYADVPFRIPGDEGFYAKVDPNFHADLLKADFFTGGYRRNFLPFVRDVVARFRDEPRIFAWEIGNELKLNPLIGDLNHDPHIAAFIEFKLAIAREITQIDPNHLITTGMISTHHAWLHNDTLRQRLYASPLIDFLTVHCYNEEYENDDSQLAATLNKPFIVEEAGFGNKYGGDRSGKVTEDMQRWFGLGARGYMQWGFMATPHDMGDGDGDSGMDKALHQDWDALFHAYRARATALVHDLPTWVLPEVQPEVQPIEAPGPASGPWTPGQTVFAQDWLNVRKSPGHVGKLGNDVLGLLAPGTSATIRENAVPKDGLIWWPIHATLANGATVDGWAAAANANTILLATAAPRAPARAAVTGVQHAFAQTYINLRKDPGYVGKPGDHVLGQIPHGAPVMILDGPQSADGLTWWRVRAPLLDNETAAGWIAEIDPNGLRLIDGTPPPPPPEKNETTDIDSAGVVMSGYLGRPFAIGSAATVVAVAANIRTVAGLGQGPETIVATVLRGTKLIPLGGPQRVDGIDWLEVERMPAGLPDHAQPVRGWIAIADPGGARLLAPAPVAAAIRVRPPFAQRWTLSQGWGGWPEAYSKIFYDGVPLKGHNGLDFATPVGTPLLAVDDGVINRVDFEPNGFGYFVIVEHAWGESLYAHLERIDVQQKAGISAGQQLGLSGMTGYCYGAHLHFGIRIFPYRRTDGWGGFCDPSPFLDPTFLVASRGIAGGPEPMAPELPGRLRP
ncbi:MAG: NBR1-Ig-like domain-containing protein [Caldilineaceae bacterium]